MATVVGTEIEYFLRVNGKWGRNRLVKAGRWELHTQDANAPALTEGEVAELVKAKLAAVKVKPGSGYYATTRKSTIEEHADGQGKTYRMKLTELFQEEPIIVRGEVS